MSAFDYLSVLFSVVLGLALTEILQGWRALVQARDRVIVYWPALLWSVVVLLIVIQDWWSMFGLRQLRVWDFPIYASIMLLVILLYLVAGLSMPEIEHHGPVDMRQNYFRHAPWFFGAFAGVVIASLMKGFFLNRTFPLDANFGFHVFFFVTALAGALSKSRWLHAIGAPLVALVFTAYIALLFERLY